MSLNDERGDSEFVGVDQVHGDVATVVAGSDPRVNTGSGHQFNGVVIYSESSGRERRHRAEPLGHSREQRNYLSERFVEPPGFGQAQCDLKRSGTVFINGPVGSGRRSAAMMLLWRRFPGNEAAIRKLTLDGGDDDELPLDSASVQQQEKLLLDLSAEPVESFEIVRRRLETFRSAVEHNGAALVVVLPVEFEHLVGEEFTRPRVVIERPPGADVVREHLAADGISPNEHRLSTLGDHLFTEPMRGLEGLVSRIVQAKAKLPEAGFEHWAKQATETIADHLSEVSSQVKNCTPGQRAMLLAASLVEGAHLDSAHAVRDALLTKLGFPADERHVLEREGLGDVLKSVSVDPSEAQSVKFQFPRYAEAVREHFWTNYPELREELRDWAGDCLSLTELTDADRDRVVARFAAQACRTGRVSDLWELAQRWTRREADGRRSSWAERCAASALSYGLENDTAIGGGAAVIRRKIYEAAHNNHLPVDLARVLVLVCGNVVADDLPDQALVRLRLLAAHRSRDVAMEARKAILDLTDNNRLFRRFLWRMGNWLARQRESDVELFLVLARSDRLGAERSGSRALLQSRSIRSELTTCWQNILPLDDSIWRATVVDWLRGARTSLGGNHFLGVLADATQGRLAPMARLHVVVRDWAHEPRDLDERAARQRISKELATRLDRAQRLRIES